MNNNRGNNRRRGRGNNRQNGGGQQLNRIDSRARGNAPQLLEKYRKLAHDAHLNGDRVNEEYYLQFADHYFRVIADARVRQEEPRQRRDDRWTEGGEGDREYAEETSEYNDGYDDVRADRFERPERPEREQRPERTERQPNFEQRRERVTEEPAPVQAEEQPEEQVEDVSATANPYEPVENPFVRDGRSGRGLKQRRPRQERNAGETAEGRDSNTLDPSTLPPAVSTPRAPAAAEIKPEPTLASTIEQAPELALEPVETAAEEPAPKPRRRTRRPRQATDDAGETLQPVS